MRRMRLAAEPWVVVTYSLPPAACSSDLSNKVWNDVGTCMVWRPQVTARPLSESP